MFIIINGVIVLEESLLEDAAIVVEGDTIKKIMSMDEVESYGPEYHILDADGDFIAPGFVDIHSDYIETIVSPRPTAMMDFDMGLRESERILITHGVTTMFHSLSLYKEEDFGAKLIRQPKHANRLIEAINDTHSKDHLIRHRVHARFEIDNFEMVEQVKEHIKNGKIHLISFMDHTPGQGQYRNLEIFKKTIAGYQDMTDAEAETIIVKRQSKEKIAFDKIAEIAEVAVENGIAVASHDDDSIEKLDIVQRIGTTISEFPTTLEVADAAHNAGLWTIAGAPNILLGGSHTGNLSAAEGIQQGYISILCSDYYPSALIHAIFIMHQKYGVNLVDMFRMLTINPAKAVKLDHEIGSIKEGKKADLLLIKVKDDYPAIKSVMVDGKIIYRTEYRQ